jgi:hypothetical protein
MLEVLLNTMNWLARDNHVGRRTFVMGSVIGSGLVTNSCVTQKHGYRMTEVKFTKLARILNDTKSSDNAYLGAVSQWNPFEGIWNNLNSKNARIRFAEFVIKQDITDKEKYLYDDSKDEDWKPCNVEAFPKRYSDEEFIECEKNRAANIDENNPMTCRQFARKLYYSLRNSGDPPFSVVTHNRYVIPRASNKYLIPIREVEIIFPEKIITKKNGKEERKRSRPHAINAIWVGESIIEFTTEKEFYNHDNWYFFDPQTDNPLFRSINYESDGLGNVFLIYPDHNVPLDRDSSRPINVMEDEAYGNHVSFAINKDKKVIPVEFVGSRDLTQLVYDHAGHGKNFPWLIAKFAETYRKGMFGPDKLIAVTESSGNYSNLEIRTLKDMKTFYENSDMKTLGKETITRIRTFMSYRDNYLAIVKTSKLSSQPDFVKAFDYLENLGVLRPSELSEYRKIVPKKAS